MMRPTKPSRLYGCPLNYDATPCGGIAVLGNDVYECSVCSATWHLDGTPKTEKDTA